MSPSTKIVVNPHAGSGRAGRQVELLHAVAQREGLEVEILLTKAPGHAQVMARELVSQGEEKLVVMGGDGTFSEVVNGVLGQPVQLGLIAMGSGNDLARSLGLPRNDLEASLQVLAQGAARPLDLGWEKERVFASSLGVGFPVAVGEETKTIHWYRGSTLFLMGMYRALRRLDPIRMLITVDGDRFESNLVALMVQNTPYTGGGLKTAPQAKIDDGLLDLVLVGEVGKSTLVWNLPRLYRGTHVNHPKFHVRKCRAVSVESAIPSRKLFDGDLAGELPVECRILPAAMQVICPVVE